MKRLSIFFFFDKDGIARDFVAYFIRALHEVSDHVCTVVNGELTDESRKKLEDVSDTLFVRDNTGFDVWAYKEAMDHLGWDFVQSYDELCLCNFTCYGPVYPFSEMFSKMEQSDCDFWGAVKHPEQPNYLLPNKQGYIYEHIMSYFTVIRSRMLHSEDFHEYWDNVPEITTKTESTAYHETVFTRHFEELGYTSAAFVDLDKYRDRCNNSSIFLADDLLMKDRCPLVKRRAFAFPLYSNLLMESAGSNASGLMQFIADNTDYDTDMIWQDLLQTQKMSVLSNNMHLGSIITENTAGDISGAAFLFYIPDTEYLRLLAPYIEQLSSACRIVLLCDDEETSAAAGDVCKAEVRMITTGKYSSTVASILACRDVFEKYEYCCCILSINEIENRLGQMKEDHCNIIFSDLIGSGEYISGVLDRFTDSHAGVLRPMKNSFSSYFAQPYNYVYGRLSVFKSVYHQLHLTVPFDDGTLNSDLDGSFWCRSDILGRIAELLSDDNIAMVLSDQSALEYMLPMIAQEYGYYTASVSSVRNASLALDNHVFMQHYFVENMRKRSNCSTFRFYDAVRTATAPRNSRQAAPANVQALLNQKIGLRYLLLLLLKYPGNKLDNIKQGLKRHIRPSLNYGAGLVNITLEGERVVFYFIAGAKANQNMYLSVDGRKFFTLKHLTPGQQMVADYIREYHYGEPLFFELPVMALHDARVSLFSHNNVHVNVRWNANFCFNALELRERDIYVRVCDGDILFQPRDKFVSDVLHSRSYSSRDKKYFREALSCNEHPYTLIAENGGAADNSWQLFRYALSQGENVIYVASEKMFQGETDPELKKHMVVYNSREHIKATIRSRRWVGSFSLRLELVPTALHDIHYAVLPAEWDFVPHGMAIGDKVVSMLHRYSWDDPSRTFASVPLEEAAYRDMYEFKNVTSLGAPRMDKWADAELHDDTVMVFFTWRIALSKRAGYDDPDKFRETDYYNCAVDVIRYIHDNFPDKKIYYVFHHEIVRNGMDSILREALEPFGVNFISFSTADGAAEFNRIFREAKYLITDFSSAAFDFAYKKGSIPIYYLSEKFIAGHYPLESKFFETQLGVIATGHEELAAALSMNAPSAEMKRRKDLFYVHQDGRNSERVFNAIFREPAPERYLPEPVTRFVPEKPRRLGIYFFFDADGVVDDYVVYYLEKLREVCSEICVVVNGILTEDGESRLRDCSDRLIIRENEGFDSWAYKRAIEDYGYDYIAENYDELVLNNFTNFGPIYPFSKMFDEMDRRDCDLWGHNRYIDHGTSIDGTRVVDHLQSYFLVFRKKLLASEDFRKYWRTLSFPETYRQAVTCHEVRCTRFFESLGYVTDAVIPWQKYRDLDNPPVYYAYRQMVEDMSTLLKRKVFFNKEDCFEFPQYDQHSVYDIADYIREKTDYPMELIAQNMKRTMTFPEEINCPEGEAERAAAMKCKDPNEKIELFKKANSRFDPEKLYRNK